MKPFLSTGFLKWFHIYIFQYFQRPFTQSKLTMEVRNSHHVTHKESQEDRRSERPEEVNENISREHAIERTETKNHTSEISTSEIENMEVHARELHKAPGHGWKHHATEFLMLFFAVFCGFLAENLREHIVEVNTEHQYIKSFYEDLTADENDLQNTIDYLNGQARIADSLSILMNHISTTQPANLVYMYLRSITRSGGALLNVNDRTIVQLRNAGGMRLIRNKGVSDSMVTYYKEVDNLKFLFDESLTIRRSLREKLEPLLNAGDFSKVIDANNLVTNPSDTLHLRSSDANIINACLIEINNIKGLSMGTAKRIELLKNRATGIRNFIGKEYHLE
jgi:hypothetical protein